MIKLCQPPDYRFRGREIWVRPEEVVSITSGDYTNIGECIVQLTTGSPFTVFGDKAAIAAMVNAALKKEGK